MFELLRLLYEPKKWWISMVVVGVSRSRGYNSPPQVYRTVLYVFGVDMRIVQHA